MGICLVNYIFLLLTYSNVMCGIENYTPVKFLPAGKIIMITRGVSLKLRIFNSSQRIPFIDSGFTVLISNSAACITKNGTVQKQPADQKNDDACLSLAQYLMVSHKNRGISK